MHLIFGAIKEISLIFLFIPITILGFIFPLTKVNKKSSKSKPIIFIHGWLNQNLLYFLFKRHLEKQGYQVHMTNFGLLTGDIDHNARLLSIYFENNNLSNSILIGSSLGGIIGFQYLQKMGGWKRVDKFISIGSPFNGFPLARLGSFLKSGKQMTPGSQYLKELSKNKTKNSKKITCISSKYDQIVPFKNSKIPKVKSETVEVVGHISLIGFSNKVFKLVASECLLN